MWAYVFGIIVLLLLWGAPVRVLLAWLSTRVTMTEGQQLAYWLLAMLAAYAALMAVTEMLLPASRLATNWTQAELQQTVSLSYGLGMLPLVFLFYRRWGIRLSKPSAVMSKSRQQPNALAQKKRKKG